MHEKIHRVHQDSSGLAEFEFYQQTNIQSYYHLTWIEIKICATAVSTLL